MPRLKNKIAIVDIETTGPNIDEGDRIIQIGAIIISEGNIVNTYSMLINPNREIPEHIAKLTGIKEEDVANAPQFNSVATLWHERLKDCVFIAHNLGFDLRILKESFERFDLEFDPIALDSVVLAKIIVPTAIGFNLTDLSRHFNLEYSEAHDAYSDALITADIVSELAKIAKEIPVETLGRMEPFLRHLRYNEIEFFTNPDKFILNDIVSDKRADVDLESENLPKQNQTLSEFIYEKWQNHPYAVLEDTHRPIPYDVIFNESILKEGRYLLSLPTLDESNYWSDVIIRQTTLEKIALLKSQGNYLHEKAFENYILQYNFKRNNQQELLVIAASIHWQALSKFGDFSEINKELSIKNLLSKHQANDLLVKNHSNFHNVIKNAKKANIIITYDANLHSMMQKNREQTEYLFNRHLIIGNVNSFIDSARYIQQSNIELSDLSNHLLNLFDDMQQIYSDNQYVVHLSKEIQSMRDLSNNLISIISNILKEEPFDNTIQQENVQTYVNIESDDAKKIMDFANKIRTKLAGFYKQLVIESEKLKKMNQQVLPLHRFINQLEQMNLMNDEINYMTISATRVNNKFYNISIQVKPILIKKESLTWLLDMQSALLVSSGNYYNSRMTGDSNWIQLDSAFDYLKLPTLFKENRHILNHPVEFIQGEDNATRISDLSDFINSDRKHLGDKIIIIMPNQFLVSDLFHKLILNDEISQDYHILAESITGSLNRIRRRIYETEKVIVILRERSFTELVWGDNQTEISVLLYNLPFQSPGETKIQAKYHYLKKTKDQTELFDDILLPQMIQRIKNVINFISNNYANEKLYILDKRLYTKYYTKEILDQLESMVEINILN